MDEIGFSLTFRATKFIENDAGERVPVFAQHHVDYEMLKDNRIDAIGILESIKGSLEIKIQELLETGVANK